HKQRLFGSPIPPFFVARASSLRDQSTVPPGSQRLSSVSGRALGAVRRNLIRPSPVAFPARLLKKSAAVSATPTFSATATAIHWFKDTPSSFARRCAAFLIDIGSFSGYVALLMFSPS